MLRRRIWRSRRLLTLWLWSLGGRRIGEGEGKGEEVGDSNRTREKVHGCLEAVHVRQSAHDQLGQQWQTISPCEAAPSGCPGPDTHPLVHRHPTSANWERRRYKPPKIGNPSTRIPRRAAQRVCTEVPRSPNQVPTLFTGEGRKLGLVLVYW